MEVNLYWYLYQLSKGDTKILTDDPIVGKMWAECQKIHFTYLFTTRMSVVVVIITSALVWFAAKPEWMPVVVAGIVIASILVFSIRILLSPKRSKKIQVTANEIVSVYAKQGNTDISRILFNMIGYGAW